MLSIHALSPTQFHVTGAPGRGDYVLKIPPALHRGFGAASEDRLWFLIAERGQDSHIDIFDAATGACVGSLNVPVYTETKNILISRDGRRMFLDLRLNGYGQAPGPLSIIDLGAASVIRTFELPRGFGVPLFERDDGKLIIQAGKTIPNFTGVGGVSMMLVDPLKGIIAEESADGLGLLHPSADGKYWLRPDATSFPSRYVVQNGVPTRYFGLTVQLWEAFPLRFRRRIVVAWLPLNRLPGMANYPHPESTPYGKAYDVISTLLETLKLKVTERLARAHFPEFYRTNDSLWHAASQCLQVFSASQFRASWEPSGKAFWVDLYPGCFVRADIEGRISPQLMLPPSLRQPQEIHNVPVRVEGLAGGRARLEFKHGTAVIAPPKGADDVFRIVTLGEHGWIPPDQKAVVGREAMAAKARREDETLRTPLASWSEADCLAAIEHLTAQVEPGIELRKYENNLYALFVMGRTGAEEEIGEDVFFERAVREHPRAAAAVARLIDKFCEVFDGRYPDLWWRGEAAVWMFGHAVKALATKGMAHIKTVRRYALLVDGHHESFYWEETVPSLLQALGKASREAVDFLIFILLRKLGDSADAPDVWRKHLAPAAKINFNPEAFARHALEQKALYEKPGEAGYDPRDTCNDLPRQHGAPVFDYLAKYLRNPDEWDNRVFAEWRRLHALGLS